MNNAQLAGFREIAKYMETEPTDWQWVGPHASQRMFGITRKRAMDYAERHGGTAKRMLTAEEIDHLANEGPHGRNV